MDQHALLSRIIDHLLDAEYDEAREAIDDLQSWTDRGGFRPNPAELRIKGARRG